MAVDEGQIEVAQPTPALPRPKPSKPHWALTAIGLATLVGIFYFAEMVLAVMMVSILLAFILAPAVEGLMRMRLPRGLAAAVAVLLMVAFTAGMVYLSYNQASSFLQDLPKYAGKIRDQLGHFRAQAETLEVLNTQEKGVVSVRAATSWTDVLTRGFGSITQVILIASFVPFLVYFMLSWQQHVRSATVMLFPLENRHTAYVTLGLISAMIRSFMIGNLLIGLFVGAISTIVFGILGLPFFYFVGFVSGFVSLVPYMGLLLALAPPVFIGFGHVSSGTLFAIIAAVLALHLFALNVLYPKFLGNRLQLNPLAVTMALLFWGWLWGAAGLLLAIPITAAMKIVFDHVASLKRYGDWLGE